MITDLESWRHVLSNKQMFTKINPVKSGYFWGKSCYFNGKSQIHHSFLLIHCNFIIIQMRKVLSFNLKLFTKINPVESGYFWGKSCYFNEKSLKTGKSQIHHSFLLIRGAFNNFCPWWFSADWCIIDICFT